MFVAVNGMPVTNATGAVELWDSNKVTDLVNDMELSIKQTEIKHKRIICKYILFIRILVLKRYE